jgi:cysteine desulfurase
VGLTYLDWAASAPPEPEALEAARDAAQRHYANPSSPHAAGRESAEALARARSRFARCIGAEPSEIVFTSGGTESNASLLLSLLDRHRLGGVEHQKARVVVSAIEHASVYEQARILQGHGIGCTVVQPRPDGHVDPQAVADALDQETVLVSVMLVNNETGAIQDVPGICRAVRAFSGAGGRRILIHTDAVQALGKIPMAVRELGVDAASFSGHKIGAPRGIGALYLRTGAAPGFLAVGGGQEAGRRPGTENLPGICALAAAAEKRARDMEANLAAARANAARLIDGLRSIGGAWIIPLARGAEAGWSPYIVSAAFPPLPAEVVVRLAEERGYCVSTGSACSTKKKDRTRVPESMGLAPETARSVIRVSLGPSTTAAEIDGLVGALREAVPPLLAISKGRS